MSTELTEEEIRKIAEDDIHLVFSDRGEWYSCYIEDTDIQPFIVELVRAVEKHHGIGKK